MIIKNEKEYKDYETRVEQLILKGTELGNMEFWVRMRKPNSRCSVRLLTNMAAHIIRCLDR